MSVTHSFSVEVALVVGDRRAVVLNNFSHWHLKNGEDGHHVFDGHIWTYNSIAAFAKVWPYLTIKQVRICLESLVEDGFLKTGNYNEWKTDQTKWYALTEKACELLKIPFSVELSHLPKKAIGKAQKGKSSSPKGQMDLPETADGFAQKGEPIPLENQLENTIENQQQQGETPDEVADVVAEIDKKVFDFVRAQIEEKRQSILTGNILRDETCKVLSITPDRYNQLANAFFDEKIGEAQTGDTIDIKGLKKHCRNWIYTQIRLGAESRFHQDFNPVTTVNTSTRYGPRNGQNSAPIVSRLQTAIPD